MERRYFSGEDNTRKEEKGKGKEERRPVTSSAMESGPSNIGGSVTHPETPLSRLASSAANLTSGLMTSRAHGRQGPDILPTGKAESSGGPQQSGTALRETARVTHASSPNIYSPLGSTFRSEYGQDKGSYEDGFSEFLGTSQGGSRKPGESSPNEKIPDTVAAAMNDGSEVVGLLGTGLIVEEDDDVLYTTNEDLSALRRAMFAESPLTETGWNDVLNFVPESISNQGSGEEYQELAQLLGVSNAAEARDVWFSQWGNVLSSYTDEVWGDLGPLVTAARQELQSMLTNPQGTTTNGLTAVRRLRQILAHVRGSC
ncbi:hypothetical protein ANO14919_082290 [Xylariales sp. No.14919]|nr:hypothetical protein ANO14919_082290 [Xylariales sp. No.14919]